MIFAKKCAFILCCCVSLIKLVIEPVINVKVLIIRV